MRISSTLLDFEQLRDFTPNDLLAFGIGVK
jgi:hypothetical protein